MPRTRSLIVALLLGLALGAAPLGIAACGGDDDDQGGDPISSGDAQALLTQLEQVQEDCDEGRTGGANFKLDEIDERIAALPEGVDPDVRKALDDSTANLRELVDSECEENRPETTETETTPTETTPPPTETTPTETTPTETTPTETTPTETTPDEGGDEDQGGGDDNGAGGTPAPPGGPGGGVGPGGTGPPGQNG